MADPYNPLKGLMGAGETTTEGARAYPGGSITTDKGDRIKVDDHPHWNDYHQRYYVWGHRMIKTKGQWSGSKGLHNFQSFTVDPDE